MPAKDKSFTPLSEKPARHRELRRGGRGRTHCKKESGLILMSLRLINMTLIKEGIKKLIL